MIKVLARLEKDGLVHASAYLFIFGYAFRISGDTTWNPDRDSTGGEWERVFIKNGRVEDSRGNLVSQLEGGK